MDETATIDVRENPENRTYEARIGDEVVGTLVYELQGNRTVLTHTWVEPSQREHGVATALSRGALDDLREKGRKVTVKGHGKLRAFTLRGDYRGVNALPISFTLDGHRCRAEVLGSAPTQTIRCC